MTFCCIAREMTFSCLASLCSLGGRAAGTCSPGSQEPARGGVAAGGSTLLGPTRDRDSPGKHRWSCWCKGRWWREGFALLSAPAPQAGRFPPTFLPPDFFLPMLFRVYIGAAA